MKHKCFLLAAQHLSGVKYICTICGKGENMNYTPHLPATCSVCGTGPYEARDACPLHAAAPDLLTALEGTHNELKRVQAAIAEGRGIDIWGLNELPMLTGQLGAAIDKARNTQVTGQGIRPASD